MARPAAAAWGIRGRAFVVSVAPLCALVAALGVASLHREYARIGPLDPDGWHRAVAAHGPVPGCAFVLLGDSITASLDVPGAVNLGIPGDTTAGILRRLHRYELHRARLVYLHIGVNDLSASTDEEVAERIARIAELIPAPVVVMPLLPVDESHPRVAGFNARIERVNAMLAGRVRLLEAPAVELEDHVHPSAEGRRALERAILAARSGLESP